jgi:peptidoglycan/LPS O-acetylase OafA/YrhL
VIGAAVADRQAAPPSTVYRADVDGLRAVAVLAVIGFHGLPRWVPGGFVGVDVFFVISGFLISGLIVSALRANRFSFREFYVRRIRRIFPSLVVVLVAAFALGWFALLADEFQQLGKHMTGAAAFVSNFVLWHEAGYFDNAANTKPLLHLWSLGVEEQFYLVWPLTLVAAWRWRRRLTPVVGTALVLSLAWSLYAIRTDAVGAFYSPASRLWELALGALLACAASDREIDLRWRHALSIVGAILIAVAAFGLNRASRFPGAWALMPAAGALLLIAAGDRAWLNRNVLSRTWLVRVGLISYPLYLWHWVLLSFAAIVSTDHTVPRGVRLAAIAMGTALAMLTYRLVERPIRFGTRGRGGVAAAALCAAMLCVGCVGFGTYALAGIPSRIDEQHDDPNERAARLARIEVPGTINCSWRVTPYTDSSYCESATDPEIAIIGDSHAAHLYHGFATSGDPVFGRALLVGAGGCWPTLGAEVRSGCDAQLRIALDLIAQSPAIRHVFLGGFYRTLEDAGSRASELYQGYLATFRRLHAAGAAIVFVIDTPTLQSDPEVCLRRRPIERAFPDFFLKPVFCAGATSDTLKGHGVYDAFVASLQRADSTVRFYDPSSALCAAGVCKVFDGSRLLYWDANHLSTYGSEYVVRDLIAHSR